MSSTKTANEMTTKNNNANKSKDEHLQPLLPEELNSDNYTITNPRKRGDSGRITSYLLHNEEPMLTETPWLRAPFGVSGFMPKGGSTKEWSINLSASVNENDTTEQQLINQWFQQWLNADELMIKHGLTNSKMIFNKEHKQEAVVTALYTKVVKQDEEKKFPMRLQPKIPKARDPENQANVLDTVPNVKVYVEGEEYPEFDENGEPHPEAGDPMPRDIQSFDELEKLVPKNGYVKALILPKTWYIAGKFGLSLTVVQLLIRKRKGGMPKKYAFGKASQSTDKPEESASGEEQVDSDAGEEEGEEEEEVEE